jgi:hypothetical protein
MSQCASAAIDGVRHNRRQAIANCVLDCSVCSHQSAQVFSSSNYLPKAEAPATMTEHKIAVSFMIVYYYISAAATVVPTSEMTSFGGGGGLQLTVSLRRNSYNFTSSDARRRTKHQDLSKPSCLSPPPNNRGINTHDENNNCCHFNHRGRCLWYVANNKDRIKEDCYAGFQGSTWMALNIICLLRMEILAASCE